MCHRSRHYSCSCSSVVISHFTFLVVIMLATWLLFLACLMLVSFNLRFLFIRFYSNYFLIVTGKGPLSLWPNLCLIKVFQINKTMVPINLKGIEMIQRTKVTYITYLMDTYNTQLKRSLRFLPKCRCHARHGVPKVLNRNLCICSSETTLVNRH